MLHGWHSADHPGNVGELGNPLGLYGDDCRYNKAGEKLVVMNFNILLQELSSHLAICFKALDPEFEFW